jgi:hypothetical protein
MTSPSDLDTTFRSHAPGYWPESDMEHWADHKWQLRNRIDSLADLEARINLTDEERAGVLLAGTKLAMAITPHFFNLIDKDDPSCPIRRQVVPRIEEGWAAPEELTGDSIPVASRVEQEAETTVLHHPRIHRPLSERKDYPANTSDFLFLRKIAGQTDERFRIKPKRRSDFTEGSLVGIAPQDSFDPGNADTGVIGEAPGIHAEPHHRLCDDIWYLVLKAHRMR